MKTRKTGHIYHYGDPEDCATIWFALHGYGQLAQHLLGKFDVLGIKEHWVIAPEGTSRFYWEGVYGKVVASWMTKKDRLDEIADYVDFLDAVWDRYDLQRSPKRKILFGFSQGCETLWRWILNRHPSFHTLVLWAGWLPEDMQFERHVAYLSDQKILYVIGDDDPYYRAGRLDVLKKRFRNAGITPHYVHFDGKHHVSRTVLGKLVSDFKL